MDTASPELELIRALAEDLALEILASYVPRILPMLTSQASARQPYSWPNTAPRPAQLLKS